MDCNSLRAIDMHAHLPWWIRDPIGSARILVNEWREACIVKGLVIAVETSIRLFKENVDEKSIYKAVQKYMDHLAFSRIPMLESLVYSPRKAIEEHVEMLQEHLRSNRDVIRAAEAFPGIILPVVSLNPEKSIDDNVTEIQTVMNKIIGVKLFPTLHFIKPNSRRLYKLYKLLEDNGKLVIVHTGCDPGVWELPPMCDYARPSLVGEVARRFTGLTFIIAHMGAYSAIKPGIFFHELYNALRLGNVYSDTSAVDPFFVKLAVEEIGWDKLLFGTDYPYVTGTKPVDWVSAILKLDIPDRAKRDILYGNADRLLNEVNKPGA